MGAAGQFQDSGQFQDWGQTADSEVVAILTRKNLDSPPRGDSKLVVMDLGNLLHGSGSGVVHLFVG